MHSLPTDELDRLKALIREYGLEAHRDAILPEARPAISLFIDKIVERDARMPMSAWPHGTHRFGGLPDLPAGTEWPSENDEPLTFVLQLALASLPEIPGNPLPQRGMLWLFHANAISGDQLKAHFIWRDCEPAACTRRELGEGADHALELISYEPFAISPVVGTDLPPVDQHDDRPAPSGSLPRSYFDLVARARDPRFEQREASGYPYSWHHLGQLFGVTSTAMQADGREGWKRLLSLEHNAVTDFITVLDAAPLHYLVPPQPAPWTSFEKVFVASAV